MRRVWFLLVAAVLMTANVAGAGPNRAAANQPAKAARQKAAKPASRSAKRTAKVKPALESVVARNAADEPLPIPANALLTQYQRVGRELMLLANERRAQIGVETEDAKLSCADMQDTFRSIKINDALKTAESRVEAAAVLAELHEKIKRVRGVAVSQECLNNPLAKECS